MKSDCCHHEVKKSNEYNYCANCLRLIGTQKSIAKALASVSIAFGLLLVAHSVVAPGYISKRVVEPYTDVALNDSSLVAYMQEIGILFPELVLQQIHWESAHFKSKICRENHNLLGIKYIKQKEATGENRGHAVFPTYKSCLRDYKRLQQYYIGNLVRKYAEDSTYGKKLFNYGK